MSSSSFSLLSSSVTKEALRHDIGDPAVPFSAYPKKLYGRDDELQQLRDALQNVRQSKNNNETSKQVVFVVGASGTGKSSLVQQAFGSLSRDANNGILCGSGKLEQTPDPRPFAALLAAVSEICRHAFQANPDLVEHVRRGLLSLGEDPEGSEKPEGDEIDETDEAALDRLADLIPALAPVQRPLNSNSVNRDASNEPRRRRSSSANSKKEGLQQLKFQLRVLLRVLASNSKLPIVLILDDLQWIDSGTLSILKTLVLDSKLTNFMFVVMYRDNEIEPKGELGLWVGEMQQHSKSNNTTTWVRTGDLDEAQVTLLLCDRLQMESSRVAELSALIHRRTSGNAFYLLQLLDVLQREQLLRKNPLDLGTAEWTWDMDTIKANDKISSSDNVVELLVQTKMTCLSAPVQAVLKVCALLGSSRFSWGILWDVRGAIPHVNNETNDTLVEASSNATDVVADGDTSSPEQEKEGEGNHPADAEKAETMEKQRLEHCIYTLTRFGILEEYKPNKFKFVHSRIHEAALGLVGSSPQQKAKLHAKVGMCMYHALGFPETLPDMHLQTDDHRLFVCVDHLNSGLSSLNLKGGENADPLGVHIAALNNQASKRAAAYSAFVPALEYLNIGIGTLTETLDPESIWTGTRYQLSLDMYNSLAKMTYCAGRNEESILAAQSVREQAKSAEDSMDASMTLVETLGANARYEEQVDMALLLLKTLDETINPSPSKLALTRAQGRVRKLLNSKTDEDILAMRDATNRGKAQAVRLLTQLTFPCENLNRYNLSGLVACRMVELIFLFGLSSYSALAFALFANQLVSRRNDIDLGTRLANLAVKLLARKDSKHLASKVFLHANFIIHWREALSHTVDHWIEAHKKGMHFGDTIGAFISCTGYGMTYFYCGLPLAPLVSDVENFNALMEEYDNPMQLFQNLPLYQALLCLTGESTNILDLYGGKAGEVRARVGWDEARTGEQAIWSYCMQIAFYCEAYDVANEMYDKVEPLFAGLSRGLPLYQARVFFFALICIHNAKTTTNKGSAIGARRNAQRHYNTVRGWVVNQKAINVVHKLFILDAAMMTIEHGSSSFSGRKSKGGSKESAMIEAFEKAIVAATKCGFFQDAALAAHLASQNVSDSYNREEFFRRACELYLRWGAHGVVNHLALYHNSSSNDKNNNSSNHLHEGEGSRRSLAAASSLSLRSSTSSKHLIDANDDSSHNNVNSYGPTGFRGRTHFDQTVRQEHQELNMDSRRNIQSGSGEAVADSNKISTSLSKSDTSSKRRLLGLTRRKKIR